MKALIWFAGVVVLFTLPGVALWYGLRRRDVKGPSNMKPGWLVENRYDRYGDQRYRERP